MAGSTIFVLPPVRSNGEKIEASWFNTIRTFLFLAFGGIIPQKNYTLDNNATVALPDFIFDAAESLCFEIVYYAQRQSDTDAITIEKGKIYGTYDGTNWTVSDGIKVNDDAGVEWQITQGSTLGQISYVSTAFDSAGYASRLSVKALPFLL